MRKTRAFGFELTKVGIVQSLTQSQDPNRNLQRAVASRRLSRSLSLSRSLPLSPLDTLFLSRATLGFVPLDDPPKGSPLTLLTLFSNIRRTFQQVYLLRKRRGEDARTLASTSAPGASSRSVSVAQPPAVTSAPEAAESLRKTEVFMLFFCMPPVGDRAAHAHCVCISSAVDSGSDFSTTTRRSNSRKEKCDAGSLARRRRLSGGSQETFEAMCVSFFQNSQLGKFPGTIWTMESPNDEAQSVAFPAHTLEYESPDTV